MKYQVCRPLTPIEFSILKTSIAEDGVLVPVEVDENGDILDGHHRMQAWQELRDEGVDLPHPAKLIRRGLTEEQKRNHARKLNVMRRQMSDDERKRIWADMKYDGMSYPAIVAATGAPYGTVYRGVNEVIQLDNLALPPTTGLDGKTYSAQQQPKAEPPPTLFEPGGSVALEPKAAAQTVKKEKEKKKAARKANQETYQQNGHGSPQPLECGVTIHNLDARQLAQHTSDVHLVITSPPYDVGIEYDTYLDQNPDYLHMLNLVFRECFSVMVEGGRIAVVVPFGVGRNPYFAFHSQIGHTIELAGFTVRGMIIWDKGTTGNRTSWGSYRMSSNPSLRDTCECIIVAQKGGADLAIPDGIKQVDDVGSYTPWLKDGDYFMELAQDHWVVAPESAQRVGHPAPFPTELVRRLTHFYGYPGCHILDPFAGSGTVGVVAKELGCQATLFELSQDYCRLAEERISNGR